jgi:hypothetical protein
MARARHHLRVLIPLPLQALLRVFDLLPHLYDMRLYNTRDVGCCGGHEQCAPPRAVCRNLEVERQ